MNRIRIELRAPQARRHRKSAAAICLTLLVVALTGCGESPEGAGDKLPTFRVKGVVTYNGDPVDDATVSFHPEKEGAPGAIGKTNSEGVFSLRTYKAGDGAPEGDYLVTVQKAEVAPPEQKSGAEMFKEMEKQSLTGHKPVEERPLSLIPEKYARPGSSKLTAKVESSGSNEFEFELKD